MSSLVIRDLHVTVDTKDEDGGANQLRVAWRLLGR